VSPMSAEHVDQKVQRLGLIAGQGKMPGILASNANKMGYQVYTAALESMADGSEAQYSHEYKSFNAGKVGAVIKYFKGNAIDKALFAGKVPKTALYDGTIKPDLKAAGLLSSLLNRSDDTILDAISALFEREGIKMMDMREFCSDLLTPEGVLTRIKPTRTQRKDIEFGFKMAKQTGTLDIGQSVVVKDGAVMAVEAIEGTDEAIIRGGKLAASAGAVVVKVARPGQDMRFDVPGGGPDTLDAMRRVGATVLALEAGKSIILERDGFLDEAHKAGISVVGVKG